MGFNAFHRIQKLRNAFQCIELTLDGNKKLIRCYKCINSQKAERRRAIDKDVVVFAPDRSNCFFQAILTSHLRDKLYLCSSKINCSWSNVETLIYVGNNDISQLCLTKQYVINTLFKAVLFNSKAARCISLGVKVNQKDLFTHLAKRRAEINRSRGFSNATLLVQNS